MKSSPQSRPGSVYLVVLSTTVLVTSIALLGLESQRNTARSVDLLVGSARARVASQSAFEIALQKMNTTDWRRAVTSGGSIVALDDGAGNTSSVTVTDTADGDLADDYWEDVQLTVRSSSSDAAQSLQTQLRPSVQADAALSYALFAGGAIEFSSVTFSANRAVYSTGNVVATSSSIIAPVASAGTISGGTYSGTNRSGVTAEKPTDPAVISTWERRGTPINYSDIASGQIRNVAIGPGINPYGTRIVNSSGIYVIDCKGSNLTITNCRIVATLIIKNCPSLRFTGSVSIQAPSESQPTLLIDGNAEISISTTNLSELTSLTNFNPVGAPDSGVSDIDILDTYPSRIYGLLYIRNTVQISGTSRLIGVTVVGDDAKISSNVGLQYNANFAANPPEGFRTPGALVVVTPGLTSAR